MYSTTRVKGEEDSTPIPDSNDDTTSPNGTSNGVSEDTIFSVLANRRRRFAIHLIKQTETPVEIGTLATKIAAWEENIAEAQVSGTERKRVYTALQQSHLPTMDDAGIVDFDKARGLVDPTPALEEVELYLDVVHGREIPWSVYYLGLAGIGIGVMAASWANLWPFVMLPDLAWGVFIAVALLVSSVSHFVYMRNRRLGIGTEPPEVQS